MICRIDLIAGLRLALAACFAVLGAVSARGSASSLNVTNYGARGDAVQILVKTVGNSSVAIVQTTNRLSSLDVGKVIEIFGGGPYTTPTNNQDLIATITAVSNGTNITLSLPAGASSNNLRCVYGTQNATAFQNCVNACSGTNTIVIIPAGNYLLIPPTAVSTNFVMATPTDMYPAVTLQTGGITFQGAGPASTILTGNGAWTMKGAYAYRGYMFACRGPVTNNYPLIFENLTMDGGVTNGLEANKAFPASTVDGSGWDETHDAVLDIGSPPLHALKIFTNCVVRHWRGEMFKSCAANCDGFIEITNCVFTDGNASAINFSFSHNISSCTFSNTNFGMEFYQGYYSNACTFQNCLFTNIAGSTVLAFNGATAGRVTPPYTVQSNSFYYSNFGILTSPADNLTVIGNKFYNGSGGMGVGSSGYQGTTINSNIVVTGNTFSNVYFPFETLGSGSDCLLDAVISSNSVTGAQSFAYGTGWGTNVLFVGNTSTASGPLNSTALTGQWYWDDPSNQFPPHQINDSQGRTNIVSYAYGMRHQIWINVTNSVFYVDDTHPLQIPAGASLSVTNMNGSLPVTLYLSASMALAPAIVPVGGGTELIWTNGAWQLATARLLTPPTNLHVYP